MIDWIYVGAVIFGAISLLIEADRNYRTSLSNHPFPYHAILEKVELENLCTPREWLSGFLFYSLLYLLAYVLILSSTELFLLVRNANLAELQVGANNEFVGPLSDPVSLADSTYGKPIFVSAFLIAFLSVGAMRPIETYMRALAHRLAGVPRGVYKVLERLQTVNYLKLNRAFPSPLLNKFEKRLKTADMTDLSDQYIGDIRTQLSSIDCLSPSVTAGFSRLHFPMTHFDAFKEVPGQLSAEIDAIEEDIDKLEPTEANLKVLHEKAVMTANSAKAVFAVFYVRNNHAIKNTDPNSPIARIEKLITRGYRIELNAFAMSICISFILSLGVCFYAYYSWNESRVSDKPTLADSQIDTTWKRLFEDNETTELEACKKAATTPSADIAPRCELAIRTATDKIATENPDNPPAVTADDIDASWIPLTAQQEEDRRKRCATALQKLARGNSVTMQETCRKAIDAGKRSWLRDQFARFAYWSFWDTLQRGMMVFGVVVSTIFFREVRVDQNSWKPWSFKRIPFLRLLSMSFSPAVIGVFALSSGAVIKLIWDSNFDVTQRQITILFQGDWIYFAWHLLPGMFLSLATLTLMDKHDDWAFLTSLITGLIAAAFLLFLSWVIFHLTTLDTRSTTFELPVWLGGLTIDHAGRDTLITGILPASFVVLFAWLLEATEEAKTTTTLPSRLWARLSGTAPGGDSNA